MYDLSPCGLERRRLMVVEANQEAGIIKAKATGSALKPSVVMEIKINQISDLPITLDIDSSIEKGQFRPIHYENSSEH